MNFEEVVGTNNLSLVDRLRAKRSQVAIQAKRELTRLDRQIQLVQQSEAEKIIRDAEAALGE